MSEPLPAWLTVPTYPTTKDQRDLQRLVHETVFEAFLDHIIEGRSGTHFIRTDPRDLSYGRFMAWVKSNPDRNKRYEEAREIGTEAVLEDMKAIADGEGDSVEDVQRSTLRVNVRKIELQAWNKRRYGAEKEVGGGSVQVVICRDGTPMAANNVYDMTPTVVRIAE